MAITSSASGIGRIESILGEEAEDLLGHECNTIAKERLHLPGPDFVDRVVRDSDRPVPVLRSQTEAPRTHYFAATRLGMLAMDRGEHEEADRHLREALELAKIVEGNTGFMVFRYTWLARNLSMQGRFEEAEAVLALVPNVIPIVGSKADPLWFAEALPIARARVKLDRGDPAAALALLPPDRGDMEDFTSEDRRLLRGEEFPLEGPLLAGTTHLGPVWYYLLAALQFIRMHRARSSSQSWTILCRM